MMHGEINTDIEELAAIIRECFIAEKKKNGELKRYYNLKPETYRDDFIKAAKICYDYKFDPVDFVSAHFQGKHPDEVFAQFLHGRNSIKLYHDYVINDKVTPEEDWKFFDELVSEQTDVFGRDLNWVLMSDLMDIPAWFRILCTDPPIPEVVVKYKHKAREELTPEIKKFLEENKIDYKIIIQ